MIWIKIERDEYFDDFVATFTETVTCGAPADHFGWGATPSVAVLRAWAKYTQWRYHRLYMAAWAAR